jgi:hypothetical protein
LEERQRLKRAATDQKDSHLLLHLLETADLTLDQAIETGDFQTFLIVLPRRPLSKDAQSEAVKCAARVGQVPMLRYLLNSGSITSETPFVAMHFATTSIFYRDPAHLETAVLLLLAKAPQTEWDQKWGVQYAAHNNNLTLVRLLFVNCDPYDQIKIQRWIIQNTAFYYPHLLDTVVRLFMALGPFPTELRLEVVLRRSISLRTRIEVGKPLIGWKTTAAVGVSAVAGYIFLNDFLSHLKF